jgi:DNA-binding transcriptional ArsR family regulator
MEEVLQRIKALADENRLKILKLLLSKDLCVGALAKKLDISESAVSQQLKVLREADLVLGEKKGYYVHYTVKKGKLKQIGDFIDQLAETDRSNSRGNGCCHEKVD